MILTLLLIMSAVRAGFGEIGGQLNYNIYPNSSITNQWGLINNGNSAISFNFGTPSFRAMNNLSKNQTPTITFYPASGQLQPGVTYVNVTVSSNGLKVNQSWIVGVEALTAPGNATSGANIQVGTLKMLYVNVIPPPKTIKNPLMVILGLAFIPLLGIAASLGISFGWRRRFRKQSGGADKQRKRAGVAPKKSKPSSRRRS